MRCKLSFTALALGMAALPSLAQADDPNDPDMRNAAARAVDKELIRQMNLDMLAQVTARDTEYAKGWRAYAQAKADPGHGPETYEQKLAAYNREQARYAQDRKRYEQAMAQWREDVAACHTGDRAACQ